MEAELNESQSVISNYFSDCLDDNTTTSDKEENVGGKSVPRFIWTNCKES